MAPQSKIKKGLSIKHQKGFSMKDQERCLKEGSKKGSPIKDEKTFLNQSIFKQKSSSIKGPLHVCESLP